MLYARRVTERSILPGIRPRTQLELRRLQRTTVTKEYRAIRRGRRFVHSARFADGALTPDAIAVYLGQTFNDHTVCAMDDDAEDVKCFFLHEINIIYKNGDCCERG
jgi:hypothetical protein